ncbi:MAG: AsmA-like C-terminal region-containing protein [Opitutales bacterium]
MRIPNRVVEEVVSQIDPELWLAHEGVFLNFGGVVSVKSLSAGIKGVSSPVIELGDIVLDLDVGLLMLGRIELDQFKLSEGKLFLPALYSPTGVTEELLEVARLDLRDEGRSYNIQQALLRFGSAAIWGAGEFSVPRQKRGDGEVKSFEKRDLEEQLRGLYDFRERMSLVSSPLLKARFKSEQVGENSVDIYVSGSIQAGNPYAVEVELFEVFADVNLSQMQIERVSLEARAGGLAWKDDWTLSHLDFYQELEGEIILNEMVDGLEWVAMGLQGPGLRDPVDLLSVRPSLGDFTQLPVDVSVFWDGALVSAQVNASFLSQEARISARSRGLGIRQLETVEMFSQTGLANLVWGLEDSNFYIDTAVRYDETVEWESLKLRGDTGPIAYKGVWLDNAWAELSLFKDRAEIHDFAITGPLGDAAGSLDFNWWSKDLELYISSQILPPAINSWMEPWWVNLWEPFTFLQDHRPHADFYVSTTIGKPRSTHYFGQVLGSKTAYKGACFDQGSARVWGKPRFTEVFDLQLSRPEGDARGSLTWTFFPDRYGLMVTEYALDGRVDLRNGEKIFPSVVQEITANFDPEGPIDLRVEGHTYGSGAKPEEKIRAEGGRVSARADNPIGVYNICVDSLDIEVEYGTNGVDIPSLEFLAGGGVGSGALRVSYVEKEGGQIAPELSVDVEMEGLRRDRIFAVFPMLKTDNAPSETEDDGGNTRINLNFQAVGDPLDRFSFQGSGRARMTGGNLNEMNVFGGLSETLTNTAFPVGSLSLNEIESPVNIRGSLLEFKNIKGSGRGVRLRGDGSYEMKHDHMNFKMNVIPGNMEETPVYSLFTAILRPVASAFPIRVWGPISDPNWALDIFTTEKETEVSEASPAIEPPAPVESSPEILEEVPVVPIEERVPPGDLGEQIYTPPIAE